jgi:hypothetical protein
MAQSNPVTAKIFNDPQCFNTVITLRRCVTNDNSIYFQSTRQSLTAYINENNISWTKYRNTTKLSTNDFWFIYEVLSVELRAASLNAFWDTSATLISRLKQNILIGQICYGVSLALAFLVFFFAFKPLPKTFADEALLHRNTLFLVPQEVLRESKSIQEYIEGLHDYLFGNKK